MVLSSNTVSATNSGVVAPLDPFTISSPGNSSEIRILDNSAALIPGATAMHSWTIVSHANLGNNRRLLVRRTSDASTIVVGPPASTNNCATPCTGNVGPNLEHGDVMLSRALDNGAPTSFANQPSSIYTVRVLIEWTYTTGSGPARAEYEFSGAGRSLPSVRKL